MFAGCSGGTAIERLTEARRLSADLFIQFTRASNAANQAVMADTDEASIAFANQAEETKKQLQADIDALRPVLRDLDYADETRLLEEFVTAFTEYRDLDRRILELAVENTNLKAQRLSFGESQQAADAFAQALNAIVPAVPAADTWKVRALVAGAVADLRAIQVAQAPHIAEADDAVMTRIEQQMKTSEAAVRSCARLTAAACPIVDATTDRGGTCRLRPVHVTERADRRPLAAQHQRALADADLERERQGDERVRAEPARAAGRALEAPTRRQPVRPRIPDDCRDGVVARASIASFNSAAVQTDKRATVAIRQFAHQSRVPIQRSGRWPA